MFWAACIILAKLMINRQKNVILSMSREMSVYLKVCVVYAVSVLKLILQP